MAHENSNLKNLLRYCGEVVSGAFALLVVAGVDYALHLLLALASQHGFNGFAHAAVDCALNVILVADLVYLVAYLAVMGFKALKEMLK
ncbi:hypothetical protein KDW40_01890 [Burkholderia cenocepacia]|uniref:hypothetical protein n=1 Tax=Burkholderia TaxID=32008 RepID=UPI0003066AB3|nr:MULTISPECIES: hypothetical protein [Burkholderia]MBR8043149.1 hypothetical protein [Burkholderia cenocepacia]MBR8324481.1 hypothetical protein [Burkholderia cenocepacia]